MCVYSSFRKAVSCIVITCIYYAGCGNESGDLKNVLKSKWSILFGFNEYERNIDMKAFSFLVS